MEKENLKKLSFAGFLVAIGIVFGDIGTSPLYTFKAILENKPVTELIALGGVSAIFWTLFFQTTVKKISLADEKEYGLDYSNVVIEKTPLVLTTPKTFNLTRDD